MKKVLIIVVVAIVISTSGFAQIHNPVKWSTSVKKISDTEYDLISTATIEGEWHLYSQSVPEDGPVPTTFTYTADNKNYLKKGNTKEEEGHTVNDKIFEMEIKYFDKKATFKQRIKLRSKEKFNIKATVEYMVCDDSRCLPPKEVDLAFSIQ